MRVYVVTTCIPDRGEKPCLPNVFATLEGAEAYADEMLRNEWATNAPVDDDGEPLPYPGDWREANDSIAAQYVDGSWGEWQLTAHDIDGPGETPGNDARPAETVSHEMVSPPADTASGEPVKSHGVVSARDIADLVATAVNDYRDLFIDSGEGLAIGSTDVEIESVDGSALPDIMIHCDNGAVFKVSVTRE